MTEEVLLRHKELAVKHHKTKKLGKSAIETLYIYIVILTHSWAIRILDKEFKDLCELYGLNLENSYRRLKTLREKGWIENTKKHIRPLLIHRPNSSKTVIITPDSKLKKTVTVTPNLEAETVTVTPENCNSYSKSDEKTVIVTLENGKISNPVVDYDDSKTFLNLKKKTDSTTNSSNSDSKSKFSIEECLRYVMLRTERGEELETPHRLAKWLHQIGEMDPFIQATLYPEQPDQITTTGDDDFTNVLAILRDVNELGDDVNEPEKYYTPEVWKKLMGELRNVE